MRSRCGRRRRRRRRGGGGGRVRRRGVGRVITRAASARGQAGATVSERALVATRGTEFGLPVADRAMYAQRVLNSDPFTRRTVNVVAAANSTAHHLHHHHCHPWPNARVGGGGSAGAARIHTHTRIGTLARCTHTTHTRARTHGVGDALATMRNRSASVWIKVTTPPYSTLYTGCFHPTHTTVQQVHPTTAHNDHSVFFQTPNLLLLPLLLVLIIIHAYWIIYHIEEFVKTNSLSKYIHAIILSPNNCCFPLTAPHNVYWF